MKARFLALLLAVLMLFATTAYAERYFHATASPTPVVNCEVSGVVSDAVDPSILLSDVKVSCEGLHTRTDRSGRYTLRLTPGSHTLLFEKDGYISTTSITELNSGASNTLNCSMSKALSTNQYRVVLTWGLSPKDLDSHLLGQSSRGRDYHVYFSDKTPTYAYGEANLDKDDTTSFGPETTTFTIDPSRKYTFFIHDYTNQSIRNSKKMSQSGAKVDVYCGNDHVRTYSVPVNKTGVVWTVFKIENGVLLDVNEIGNSMPN